MLTWLHTPTGAILAGVLLSFIDVLRRCSLKFNTQRWTLHDTSSENSTGNAVLFQHYCRLPSKPAHKAEGFNGTSL